jgi:hypothetical protein
MGGEDDERRRNRQQIDDCVKGERVKEAVFRRVPSQCILDYENSGDAYVGKREATAMLGISQLERNQGARSQY